MGFFTIPPSGGFRDRMALSPTDCRLIILSYIHREGSAMIKRDGWKAFLGMWRQHLHQYQGRLKPALAARTVRLEQLEPRWVLTAPVANVGTNLGNPSNDGTYAIYEGGYDPLAEEFLQTGLVLNGNSPGTGPPLPRRPFRCCPG
jgi:hypothetical protein